GPDQTRSEFFRDGPNLRAATSARQFGTGPGQALTAIPLLADGGCSANALPAPLRTGGSAH
ncbi:MAG: hypothetical protein ACRDP3_11500, partial [Streptomyces sp.]